MDERAFQEAFITNLKKENHWLTNYDLKIDNSYEVKTLDKEYIKIIVSFNTDAHSIFLYRKPVIVDSIRYRLFKHIKVHQCSKCQLLGHIAFKCTNVIPCKLCAGAHAHSKCTITNIVNVRCINCLWHTKYSHSHLPKPCANQRYLPNQERMYHAS